MIDWQAAGDSDRVKAVGFALDNGNGMEGDEKRDDGEEEDTQRPQTRSDLLPLHRLRRRRMSKRACFSCTLSAQHTTTTARPDRSISGSIESLRLLSN